jgi:hypothetical protein
MSPIALRSILTGCWFCAFVVATKEEVIKLQLPVHSTTSCGSAQGSLRIGPYCPHTFGNSSNRVTAVHTVGTVITVRTSA